MRKYLVLLVLVISPAQAMDHSTWGDLLKQHVDWARSGHTSVVDYEGFAHDREKLNDYLEQLSSVDQGLYEGWANQKQLAFLINAYNAFTVELILRDYPDIDSIRDIGGWFSGPWDKDLFRLLGEKRTLDELEHEMIRVWFDEPRIHFAVNCASVGCPALRPEAFTGRKLDDQLEDSTRRFLTDRQRNYLDEDDARLYVTPLFKWYDEDFSGGEVKEYLADQASLLADSEKQKSVIEEGSYRLSYTDYDWDLNTRNNIVD